MPARRGIGSIAAFTPPESDAAEEDYTDACAAAVEAPLADLVAAAEAAGWHRADILSLTVSDFWRLAGTEATVAILEGTADALCRAERGEQT